VIAPLSGRDLASSLAGLDRQPGVGPPMDAREGRIDALRDMMRKCCNVSAAEMGSRAGPVLDALGYLRPRQRGQRGRRRPGRTARADRGDAHHPLAPASRSSSRPRKPTTPSARYAPPTRQPPRSGPLTSAQAPERASVMAAPRVPLRQRHRQRSPRTWPKITSGSPQAATVGQHPVMFWGRPERDRQGRARAPRKQSAGQNVYTIHSPRMHGI
jgi:hypothetical protein